MTFIFLFVMFSYFLNLSIISICHGYRFFVFFVAVLVQIIENHSLDSGQSIELVPFVMIIIGTPLVIMMVVRST